MGSMVNCLRRRAVVIPSIPVCLPLIYCDYTAAPMKWKLCFHPFNLDLAMPFFARWSISKRDTHRDLKYLYIGTPLPAGSLTRAQNPPQEESGEVCCAAEVN